MKLPHRRQFLHLAAGVAALPAVSRIVSAQTYPTRPVRIIVGFSAGGSPDIFTRLMAQWLSERLGQQFIIENRTGAAGNLATEAGINAAPDGYTLFLATVANTINTTLYDRLNFNLVRDIAPVAGVVTGPNILVVNPSLPVNTVPEFITYAKANPGKINFASGGNGTSVHLSGELFNVMAGVRMVHVPYRGGAPASLPDLFRGQVHAMFDNLPNKIEYIRTGQLRALAVTSATRWPSLPDIPTVAEFLPGYEVTTWMGFSAPKRTPTEIIDKLNKEIDAGLINPKIKARLAELGGAPLVGSPADFGKFIADETEKWGKVIRAAHIRPE
jgi:tripartite-type tricarboxylate transporter receptor subunit TctC